MTAAVATGAGVAISFEARRSIADCAAAALPEESCGVLVGRDGERAEIVAAWQTPNRASDDRTRRFALAPADLYGQTVRARNMALDVIGFFHSHPAGDARPSPSDIRDAGAWPGYVHAIYACAPRNGAPRLRIYRTHMLGWQELALEGLSR
jgi:proteasome lid subunit RPN8/RPN11